MATGRATPPSTGQVGTRVNRGERARRRARGLHNITRIIAGDYRAWLVRIVRGGEQHEKSFADSKFGGVRRALRAAQAWRDSILAVLPAMHTGGKRTPSGIPFDPGYGCVRRTTLPGKTGPRDVFTAWIRIENRGARQTSYSVRIHGVSGARQMAERWFRRERPALRARLRMREAA